jgi:hypothetical protein
MTARAARARALQGVKIVMADLVEAMEETTVHPADAAGASDGVGS